MQNAKFFQQLCEQMACTKSVELLYGKKQCNSLNDTRCEEAVKKVPPKRYHLKDNSFTLHAMSCCYQLHVLILKTCCYQLHVLILKDKAVAITKHNTEDLPLQSNWEESETQN